MVILPITSLKPKGQVVTPNAEESNIAKTAGDAIYQHYQIVCCEVVRSAIISTAWLLVKILFANQLTVCVAVCNTVLLFSQRC